MSKKHQTKQNRQPGVCTGCGSKPTNPAHEWLDGSVFCRPCKKRWSNTKKHE